MLRVVFSQEKLDVPGPAIFLDRDGVINCRRPGDYVLSWQQFSFTPGIETALRQCSTLRLPMIVISNQACVGKGLLDPSLLQEITTKMQESLRQKGVRIAAVYYCIHQSSDNCNCRKPKPALLLKAADDYNIDLSRSVFIGDSDTDVEAGLEAGCKPVLFASTPCAGYDYAPLKRHIPIARTAEELFDALVKCLRGIGGHASDGDSVPG